MVRTSPVVLLPPTAAVWVPLGLTLTTTVSVAPLLLEPVYVVTLTELELSVITADDEVALTPSA